MCYTRPEPRFAEYTPGHIYPGYDPQVFPHPYGDNNLVNDMLNESTHSIINHYEALTTLTDVTADRTHSPDDPADYFKFKNVASSDTQVSAELEATIIEVNYGVPGTHEASHSADRMDYLNWSTPPSVSFGGSLTVSQGTGTPFEFALRGTDSTIGSDGSINLSFNDIEKIAVTSTYHPLNTQSSKTVAFQTDGTDTDLKLRSYLPFAKQGRLECEVDGNDTARLVMNFDSYESWESKLMVEQAADVHHSITIHSEDYDKSLHYSGLATDDVAVEFHDVHIETWH